MWETWNLNSWNFLLCKAIFEGGNVFELQHVTI
jgi:hypothetical protein